MKRYSVMRKHIILGMDDMSSYDSFEMERVIRVIPQDQVEAALKDKDEKIETLKRALIHDSYTAAALSGLLANGGSGYEAMVRAARMYADEAMKQRESQS